MTYKFRKTTTKRHDTFEHLDVKSTQTSIPVRVVIIYRPPTTSVQSFLDEFATYQNEIVDTRQDILIVGDFNIHCELNSAPGVKVLNDILAETYEGTHVRLGDNTLIYLNRFVNFSVPQQHIRPLQCRFPSIVG